MFVSLGLTVFFPGVLSEDFPAFLITVLTPNVSPSGMGYGAAISTSYVIGLQAQGGSFVRALSLHPEVCENFSRSRYSCSIVLSLQVDVFFFCFRVGTETLSAGGRDSAYWL
jgi:hypothetical protein